MNTPSYPSRGRRYAQQLARAGTALSVTMLVVAVTSFSPGGSVAVAATDAGAVQIVVPPGSPTAGNPLTSGGSATAFALAVPVGAACTGDSATGGYRVQSYMVPETVNPNTLTFGLTGPVPLGSGASFRQPLFTSAGSSWVNKTTAVNTGLLTGLPILSFAWVDSGGTTFLPAGTYNVGFACTKSAGTELDKYWNTKLTVLAAANDVPSALTWAVPVVAATTTTATTTTTTATTTTVAGGSTTTSTTVAGGTTTTSTTVAGATSTTLLGSGSGTNTTVRSGSGGGQLTATGGSPLPIVLWAVLLLVFGRMAILLGRPLRVLPDSR